MPTAAARQAAKGLAVGVVAESCAHPLPTQGPEIGSTLVKSSSPNSMINKDRRFWLPIVTTLSEKSSSFVSYVWQAMELARALRSC